MKSICNVRGMKTSFHYIVVFLICSAFAKVSKLEHSWLEFLPFEQATYKKVTIKHTTAKLELYVCMRDRVQDIVIFYKQFWQILADKLITNL